MAVVRGSSISGSGGSTSYTRLSVVVVVVLSSSSSSGVVVVV